jgi:hypothetical protein
LDSERTSCQAMEINTMEEEEMNDVAGEEVLMEDMDYAR